MSVETPTPDNLLGSDLASRDNMNNTSRSVHFQNHLDTGDSSHSKRSSISGQLFKKEITDSLKSGLRKRMNRANTFKVGGADESFQALANLHTLKKLTNDEKAHEIVHTYEQV